MPYPAGIELDFRTAAASNEPDPPSVSLDPDFPEITTAASYYSNVVKYLLFQRLPPGYRVLCGVEPPAYSTNLTIARAAAERVNVTYLTTDDAVAVCNHITDEHG